MLFQTSMLSVTLSLRAQGSTFGTWRLQVPLEHINSLIELAVGAGSLLKLVPSTFTLPLDHPTRIFDRQAAHRVQRR